MTKRPYSVSVAPECIQAFNDLKLGKSTKWIIYKISDDWKEIVVEETSTVADYSVFREKLLNAKSKDKRGKEGMGGRYAVYDVEYETEGEGSRCVFISALLVTMSLGNTGLWLMSLQEQDHLHLMGSR